MGYLLGYDVGSSSVKVALVDSSSGKLVAHATSPEKELEISSPKPGWAEQQPETWWEHLKRATSMISKTPRVNLNDVQAIGISYQMHGLVSVDRKLEPVRPAIIWCDSRAVEKGEEVFKKIGKKLCLERLLNSPGNFTLSKLLWVKENEPKNFKKIHKIMLPGDWIAAKMTGEICTTPSGLSEMILWDFAQDKRADFLLKKLGISEEIIPEVFNTFSIQGEITKDASEELGLKKGIPVSYRAGDQPNNAFSLGVLEVDQAATSAGTSGVIYWVTDKKVLDEKSRVNVFLHVNHTSEKPKYGVLLCINGCGILYQWLKRNFGGSSSKVYEKMNKLAAGAPVGSLGLLFLPYGNGAERSLGNKYPRAMLSGLDFNIHTKSHIFRAATEGIAFSLNYGLEIMRRMGFKAKTIRSGIGNMFLSPVFREAFSNVTNTTLELYDTDGAQGAARGAGIGAGIFKDFGEAFRGLSKIMEVEPDEKQSIYLEAYFDWKKALEQALFSP